MDRRTAEEREQAQERTWAMLCHLSALSGILGVPMGHVIGPMIVWLVKRDELEAVDRHGRDVFNFQVSVTIYTLGLLVIAFGFAWILAGVGNLLLLLPLLAVGILVGVFSLACTVMGAIRAYEGREFRYPFAIRFLR